jgi:hypothetical protein
MESVIIASVFITMILYYLNNTNVVWEYLTLISKLLNFKTCNNFFDGILLLKSAENHDNYLLYINSIYNNFITRLISCPICVGFWLSLIVSLICKNILLLAPIAYFSLFLYYIIKILTKKSATI